MTEEKTVPMWLYQLLPFAVGLVFGFVLRASFWS